MSLHTWVVALVLLGGVATAQTASPRANEASTKRHLARLLSGPEPRLAELTLFFTQMPKGGDLHHHYSGSLYAEKYVEWLDTQGYCVNKNTYRVETDKAAVEAQRALPAKERTCLSTSELLADEHSYRELLQRWSSKDFERHGALQPPPDRQFFETFVYFSPLSNTNYGEGLRELKARALAENVGYIETTFRMAPVVADAEFDHATLRAGMDDAALTAQLHGMWAALEQDGTFNQRIDEFVASVEANSAGIDDEQFTMRYQLYVFRLLSPSRVFSAMVSGFKSAMRSPLIVGVNIVGPENSRVSMRDYTLHMKMFKFLKEKYPSVKIAVHAGELTLGMVPPEGLKFHIDEALSLAGADRIGHGMDLPHETNALGILKTLRDRDIPVEINLTSNHFILGVKGEAHPITLYRRYGVPFVISSDDAGVSRNNLSHEYVLFASQYKPDYMELKRLSYNSLRYAFLPDADKKRLLEQLDARFLKFEAEMAALSQTAVH